jgi:hypothetical protein
MRLTPAPIHTTPTGATHCPACGHLHEAITGTGTPTPGCITLCVYCRVFLILRDDLQPRLLLNAEWLALDVEYRALLTRVRDELPTRAVR